MARDEEGRRYLKDVARASGATYVAGHEVVIGPLQPQLTLRLGVFSSAVSMNGGGSVLLFRVYAIGSLILGNSHLRPRIRSHCLLFLILKEGGPSPNGGS